MCSRLHLGHSLMNSGYWSQAAYHLREAIDWMQEQEHAIRIQKRSWEDEPNFVNLRRDDVWLGCYQHLGLVLGKQDVKTGLAYLQTALSGIQRAYKPVVPSDRTAVGSLERDLANLKLRLRHFSEVEVRQHLLHAQQNAEISGNPGVQAYTHITQARMYDRLARATSEREKETRRQQREYMQQSIEQALYLVEQEQEDHDRSMRQTMCFVDTALLAQANEMSVDGQRLQRAAKNCLTYGYGHQAEKLLAMPGDTCLPIRGCLEKSEQPFARANWLRLRVSVVFHNAKACLCNSHGENRSGGNHTGAGWLRNVVNLKTR